MKIQPISIRHQCVPCFSPVQSKTKGFLHVFFKNWICFLIAEVTNYIGRRERKGIIFCISHSQKAYGFPKQLIVLNLLSHIKRNYTDCILETLLCSNCLQACQLILYSCKFRFFFLEFCLNSFHFLKLRQYWYSLWRCTCSMKKF